MVLVGYTAAAIADVADSVEGVLNVVAGRDGYLGYKSDLEEVDELDTGADADDDDVDPDYDEDNSLNFEHSPNRFVESNGFADELLDLVQFLPISRLKHCSHLRRQIPATRIARHMSRDRRM